MSTELTKHMSKVIQVVYPEILIVVSIFLIKKVVHSYSIDKQKYTTFVAR